MPLPKRIDAQVVFAGVSMGATKTDVFHFHFIPFFLLRSGLRERDIVSSAVNKETQTRSSEQSDD